MEVRGFAVSTCIGALAYIADYLHGVTYYSVHNAKIEERAGLATPSRRTSSCNAPRDCVDGARIRLPLFSSFYNRSRFSSIISACDNCTKHVNGIIEVHADQLWPDSALKSTYLQRQLQLVSSLPSSSSTTHSLFQLQTTNTSPETTMKAAENGVHVLMFPYPAQGHLIPLLDLTHQLVIRNVTATILVTPENLPILKPLLFQHASIRTLVLPFPTHPSIPSGIENVQSLPQDGFRTMIPTLGELHNTIFEWFLNHASPPVAIISDISQNFKIGTCTPVTFDDINIEVEALHLIDPEQTELAYEE
ncbi:hypothetical protein RJ639_037084 [Escallonia herrerae]|uniref:Uncharacterized protein n=1 Tax=Escallonia herrerae TaxID=1293975 RepID=A0AA88WQW1_9ASTE|nr:hypothetical protein RJ639_037084 [Escallonia herrerae]